MAMTDAEVLALLTASMTTRDFGAIKQAATVRLEELRRSRDTLETCLLGCRIGGDEASEKQFQLTLEAVKRQLAGQQQIVSVCEAQLVAERVKV